MDASDALLTTHCLLTDGGGVVLKRKSLSCEWVEESTVTEDGERCDITPRILRDKGIMEFGIERVRRHPECSATGGLRHASEWLQ